MSGRDVDYEVANPRPIGWSAWHRYSTPRTDEWRVSLTIRPHQPRKHLLRWLDAAVLVDGGRV